MLTLLVMRHAESDWDQARETDHARTLTKQGAAEARSIAKLLKRHSLVPTHILGSNAARARETADLVAGELAYRGDLCFYEDLYDSKPAVYLRRLQSLDPAWATVLLVAHNPVVEQFVKAVCAKELKMKTANVAQVQFEATKWSVLGEYAQGTLAAFWEPEI